MALFLKILFIVFIVSVITYIGATIFENIQRKKIEKYIEEHKDKEVM